MIWLGYRFKYSALNLYMTKQTMTPQKLDKNVSLYLF
jgi:hypothetical protein